MMKEENNIDRLFRENLKDFSEDPPAFVWDGIKEKVADGRRSKRIAWYSWSAVAALLALAFVAGWYFNESSDKVVPQVAEKEAVKSMNEAAADNMDDMDQPMSEEEETGIENQNAEFMAEADGLQSIKKKTDSGVKSLEVSESDDIVSREKLTPPDRIKPVEAILLAENQPEIAYKGIAAQKSSGLSQSEREILKRNVASYAEVDKNEKGWRMGVNVSPGYSSYSAKYGNAYAANMTQDASEGNANMSGGIAIRYRTASRWSVESGIYYAQNGQQTGSSPHLFGRRTDADLYAAPEQMYFNTAVKLDRSIISMNSTAGIIEIKNLPAGAEIAANLENAAYSDNSLITRGEISQVFNLVEIPLYLRYLIVESKLDVEFIGGVNAGLVVGNNAFIDNQYGVQNIGNTSDISTMNISGTVGLGFSYALNKQFSLALEPRLNYYMNSISRNPEVEFRPYRVGVYTGLYYSF